jgi:hypothetical protein
MNFLKIAAVLTLLAGGTLYAGIATSRHYGVQKAMYPQGIRLRQESLRSPGAARTYARGGLRRGK